jgi:hypothetical protein
MMVGFVSKEDFWFYSDGRWTRSKKECKTAAHVVLHLVLKTPIDSVFELDIDVARSDLVKRINEKTEGWKGLGFL